MIELNLANVLVAGAALFVVWSIGLVVGQWMRDKYWTMKATTEENPYGTAAFHDGKFYYVVEEGWFNKEYQLRDRPEPRMDDPKGVN